MEIIMKDANDINVKWPDLDTAEIMELFPGRLTHAMNSDHEDLPDYSGYVNRPAYIMIVRDIDHLEEIEMEYAFNKQEYYERVCFYLITGKENDHPKAFELTRSTPGSYKVENGYCVFRSLGDVRGNRIGDVFVFERDDTIYEETSRYLQNACDYFEWADYLVKAYRQKYLKLLY